MSSGRNRGLAYEGEVECNRAVMCGESRTRSNLACTRSSLPDKGSNLYGTHEKGFIASNR